MKKSMTKQSSGQIDQAFEKGESVLKMAKKGGKVLIQHGTQKVNVNFPLWMIAALDSEAEKLAIDRQAVIKTIIN